MREKWSTYSSRTRGLIIAAGSVEAVLKVVALVDLKRRPAAQVRGPKWMWAGIVLVNSAGLTSLAYLVYGRLRGQARG